MATHKFLGMILSAMAATAIAGSALPPEAQRAKQILDATGVRGGLLVHVGCGDGRLTAALHAGPSYLVQGLDTDARAVRQAREHVQKLGVYGPVSVELFDGKRLPYAENLVNLVVAEDLGGVATEEAMRVLAPGGTLYARQGGRWTKSVKPHPQNTDEWTHYLHDASGNAVAHDDVVGPPGRVQWIAEPRHMRSHEHIPGIYALVSTGGRIFYILDEAPTQSLRRLPQWHVVARDAYNGVLLWKRPFSPWFPHIVNWGATPPQLERRLVAVGGRVYVTLGLHAPLSALDAATGELLKTYDETQGTEEILCHKGTLLLAVRSVTKERVAQLEKWRRLVVQDKSPVYVRESAEPLVKELRSTEAKAEVAVVALDVASGRLLWKKPVSDGWFRPNTLSAVGDRAFYQRGGEVCCLDLKTGGELWSASSPPMRVASDRAVVCANDETVTALSVETGKPLWTQPATLCQLRDAFVINGSLWLGGFKPLEEKPKAKAAKNRGPVWGPYFVTQQDLATGKVLKHIDPENPGHHHRCWSNKATDRYILGGRRGVEFINLQTGDVLWNSWVRGVCRYGVMPCNGLLYAPPHACGCYIAAKLSGFHALAPASAESSTGEAAGPPLEQGPAYEAVGRGQSAVGSEEEWPTYRHDAQRSGSTRAAVPAALHCTWQADLGGRLSSPTVAEGKVFVAAVDEHRVCALNAGSGQPAWQFTAGARVDSPPTIHGGSAIFGCRDGHAYSVRASDGALAWRLRAARDSRRVVVCGQLESPSPLFGSILVQDGAAYLTAGRSSYLDGGIDLCRVQPETGRILSTTPIYSPDPKTGRQPKHYGPCNMPGTLADILTSDDRHVYLRDMVFDPRGAVQPKGNPHLLTLTGFLDDTWPHRSYWIFGTQCSLATGCSGRDRSLVYGRLLVFDGPMVYGYGRRGIHWSNQLEDGPYRLFALKQGEAKEQWAKPLAIQVRAMVLAGKVLFIAGPAADAAGGPSARGEGRGALLLSVAASDGAELARCPLDSPPVLDGMAAAGGRLFLSLENGRVVCMAGEGTR
ncbi:MAG TPA: PQQ-binding-like beta-propeller repeat protein [Planctomycetota bacterium]|nr:PQQ-binding-like beta-propeller repeat protein [Planctomycetota bacterium]